MAGQLRHALRDLLEPVLANAGLDVEDVDVSTAGRRRVVRVLVDKDGGVTLDDLADATTVVGERLDTAEVLGDLPYTLEVTSPGVDRPLTAPRHWRRNLDRLVTVTMHDGTTHRGRIAKADDDSVLLDAVGDGAPTSAGPTEVQLRDVATARVEIEFNRPRAAKEV